MYNNNLLLHGRPLKGQGEGPRFKSESQGGTRRMQCRLYWITTGNKLCKDDFELVFYSRDFYAAVRRVDPLSEVSLGRSQQLSYTFDPHYVRLLLLCKVEVVNSSANHKA